MFMHLLFQSSFRVQTKFIGRHCSQRLSGLREEDDYACIDPCRFRRGFCERCAIVSSQGIDAGFLEESMDGSDSGTAVVVILFFLLVVVAFAFPCVRTMMKMVAIAVVHDKDSVVLGRVQGGRNSKAEHLVWFDILEGYGFFRQRKEDVAGRNDATLEILMVSPITATTANLMVFVMEHQVVARPTHFCLGCSMAGSLDLMLDLTMASAMEALTAHCLEPPTDPHSEIVMGSPMTATTANLMVLVMEHWIVARLTQFPLDC